MYRHILRLRAFNYAQYQCQWGVLLVHSCTGLALFFIVARLEVLNRQIIGIREYYGVNITHKTGSCEVLAHIAMKYIRPGLLSKNAYRGSMEMGRWNRTRKLKSLQ